MKKVSWSKDRPTRPDRDPLLDDIVKRLNNDKRSNWALANVSGLAQATLTNWQNGKVRRPMGTSLQMAYNALGYELRPVKRK